MSHLYVSIFSLVLHLKIWETNILSLHQQAAWPWLNPKAFAHICQGNSPGVAPRTKQLGPSNRYVTNFIWTGGGNNFIESDFVRFLKSLTCQDQHKWRLPHVFAFESGRVSATTGNWTNKLGKFSCVFPCIIIIYLCIPCLYMFVYGKFPWLSRVVSSLGSCWSKNNHGTAGMLYEEPKERPMNLWGDSHCATKKEIGPRLQNTDCNFSWKYTSIAAVDGTWLRKGSITWGSVPQISSG